MENFESSVENSRPLRALVVEDTDTDYLLLIRQIAKVLAAITCVRAENRAQLLSALAEPWDFIVTDYHLLDIEGEELLAVISGEQPDIPCILLSGSIVELEAAEAPANVFARLEKGDFAALRAALTAIVSR